MPNVDLVTDTTVGTKVPWGGLADGEALVTSTHAGPLAQFDIDNANALTVLQQILQTLQLVLTVNVQILAIMNEETLDIDEFNIPPTLEDV